MNYCGEPSPVRAGILRDGCPNQRLGSKNPRANATGLASESMRLYIGDPVHPPTELRRAQSRQGWDSSWKVEPICWIVTSIRLSGINHMSATNV